MKRIIGFILLMPVCLLILGCLVAILYHAYQNYVLFEIVAGIVFVFSTIAGFILVCDE